MTTTNFPAPVAALLEKGDCSGPVTEEFISEVEHQHELTFPSEYRTFLLRYGAALLPGVEVYGLVPAYVESEPPVWTDLRSQLTTRRDRLCARLVPISDDGSDLRFYLSCADGPTFGTVLVHGPGADEVCVSSGFFEFLERAAADGISAVVPA
ncbi:MULTISPECIES: SMI1/KNR4 family protein [unclassified Variovorax]|uniref:SMI1/KNR4 family protein n=1 Tax=unclassified Variovorax TaxID=663243 RepID=UPI0033656CFA